MAEKSRRWEESAGKDKRQHIHTYTQHIAERNEYYRLVGLCTDRVSISLFLRLFPSSLSLHLSESSVSRTGTVAELSGIKLDQLSLLLFPSFSSCSTVNAMIMSALGSTGDGVAGWDREICRQNFWIIQSEDA